MGCILALLSLAFPRFVLLLLAIFSHYLHDAFQTRVWPVLGFLFMPVTTLAYAWSMHAYGRVEGFGMVAVIVAVLLDLGLISIWGDEGRKARRRRREF